MRWARRLTWAFPLVVIGLLTLLYRAGAAEVSRAMILGQLAQQYGVSEGILEEYVSLLPQGWEPDDLVKIRGIHQHSGSEAIEVLNDPGTGVTLVFAHMGDGEFSGQDEPLRTSYVLINNSLQDASGTLEFFSDQGDPLELSVDGVFGSSFDFTIPSGQGSPHIRRIKTDGNAELKSGWARIRSDQPLVVTSSFGAARPDGSVISDVAVGASELGTEFTIFADTIGSNDTAVAACNPHDDQSVDIQLSLRDASGVLVAREVLSLPPLGHIARFLGQLFPEVDDIQEFEGTVVLESMSEATSDVASTPAGDSADSPPLLEFAGLSLRVSGTVLTSLPMVPPPAPDADHTRLAFPQAADGQAGDLKVSTTPVILNNTAQAASGTIEFFKGDGSPNEVRVESVASSSIPFNINPGGVFRLDTDGEGELAVGWARVTVDQPLAGVAIFTVRNAADQIVAAVGVEPAALRHDFEMIADTTDLFNTAIALVNPLEGNQSPATVRLTLVDQSGFTKSSTDVELGSRQHASLFLTELFPGVQGIDEFQGRLVASVQQPPGNAARDYVIAMSLRSAEEKLTSVPIFQEEHGFAPSMHWTFAQTLAATAPAVRLALHQNARDLNLASLRVRIPGASLREEVIPGRPLGEGYLTSPQRSLLLAPLGGVESDGDMRSIGFELVSSDRSDSVQLGSGNLSSDGETLTLEFDYMQQPARNILPIDSDLVLWLDPGIVFVPDREDIVVTTDLESVPRDRRASSALLRRTRAETGTQTLDAELARVDLVLPHLLKSGSLVRISGGNFGDAPQIHFPLGGSGTMVVDASLAEDGALIAPLPAGVANGPIRVDNGNGPGNGYQVASWFNPALQLEWVEGSDQMDVAVHLVQAGDAYPIQAFDVRILNQNPAFAELSPGDQIGTFLDEFDGVLRDLFVTMVDGDQMTAEARDGASFDVETLHFTIDSNGEPSLSIRWEEGSPALAVRPSEGRITLTLTGTFLDPPPTGTPLIAIARTTSALTGAGFPDGVDTSLSGLAMATLRSQAP